MCRRRLDHRPPPPCPDSVRCSWPLTRSHTLTVPSHEPETTRPSPVTANAFSHPPCPDSVRSSWPLFRSHTFTVPSSEPETTRPSPVNANALTPLSCPDSVRTRAGDSRLVRQHSRACP